MEEEEERRHMTLLPLFVCSSTTESRQELLNIQYGHGKCGLPLQGYHDQIRHLRDISIKDIFAI